MNDSKGTVIIINNEEDSSRRLRQVLKSEGYSCLKVSTIKEAMTRLQKRNIDVALVDIILPDGSGLELLHEIKENFPSTIVIVAPAIREIDAAIESLKKGAYDYVTKPFNYIEVINRVERAMEKRSLERKIEAQQTEIKQQLEDQIKHSEQIFLGAMVTISVALEAKDPYTAGHSRRVSEMTVAIGKKLGLDEDKLEDLRIGSLLHDIGKLVVDPNIINKQGTLSNEEYTHVMNHTMAGVSIVGSFIRNTKILDIIENHHSHYDGGGHNQVKIGENASELSRVVALADSYDAMTSNRPYRTPLSREQALTEIEIRRNTQFDPLIVDAFLEMSENEILLGKRKVLVVDDDKIVRMLVRSILSNDYDVIEAADGEEALNMVRDVRPDLILTDILMPRKDGLQLCYELKINRTTEKIPIVILTAIGHELDRKLSNTLGANEYLTKPFSPHVLLDTVNRFFT
ncbi:response regulator [Chloroflexota bacterium]